MVVKCTYGHTGRRRSADDGGTTSGVDNLTMLAEVAAAISECAALCSHSDLATCYLTYTKHQQNGIVQARHSQFHPKPKISPMKLKSLTKRQPSPPFPKTEKGAAIELPHRPNGASTSALKTPNSISAVDSGEFPRSLRIKVCNAAGVMGSEFILVMRKEITKTDMEAHNSRLSLPTRLILNNGFLTGEEMRELHKEEGKPASTKIGVFLDPDMEIVPEVAFVKWNMKRGYIYNISGRGWKNVVGKGRLAAGDWVEVWSFRTEAGELCFSLVTLEQRRAATASEKEEAEGRVMMIECGESSTKIGSVIGHEEEEESQVGRNHVMMMEYGESSTKIGHEEEEEGQVGRNHGLDLSLRL